MVSRRISTWAHYQLVVINPTLLSVDLQLNKGCPLFVSPLSLRCLFPFGPSIRSGNYLFFSLVSGKPTRFHTCFVVRVRTSKPGTDSLLRWIDSCRLGGSADEPVPLFKQPLSRTYTKVLPDHRVTADMATAMKVNPSKCGISGQVPFYYMAPEAKPPCGTGKLIEATGSV